MNQLTTIIQELEEAALVLTKFVSDKQGVNKIADAANMMSEAIQKGHKIIACGNGGSHCDAMRYYSHCYLTYRVQENIITKIV